MSRVVVLVQFTGLQDYRKTAPGQADVCPSSSLCDWCRVVYFITN